MQMSVSCKNAVRAIVPFVLVVATVSMLLVVSLNVMSAMRAYIGGESVWSKAEKDAVFNLSVYAQTRDSLFYKRYLEAFQIVGNLPCVALVSPCLTVDRLIGVWPERRSRQVRFRSMT